jgi:hypothetical protein
VVWHILQGVAAATVADLALVAQVAQEEEDEVIGMIQILLEEPQIRAEEEAQLVLLMLTLLVVMAAQDLFLFGIH